MKLRIGIYTRISKDREGAQVGVNNQEEACLAIAGELDGVVVHKYRDNDAGASKRSKAKRPGFAQMIADAEAGKLDVIVAYSMSRLTRRAAEWVKLIDLAEKQRIQFRFKVSPSFDLQTADGRATALTIAAWDAAEAERTGERIQFARQAALAKGEDMRGVRPFGYEPGCKKLREEEADALRWAYRQVIDGKTLLSIAREFTARGLKRDRANENSWRPQTIRNMLLRERNRGHLVVKGVLYATDVLAIVDNDTWEAAHAVLTDPARKPSRGRQPVTQSLTGILRCGTCGNYVKLTTNNGKRALTCAIDGRPVATLSMKHATMQLDYAEAEMADHVRRRLLFLAVIDAEFTTTTPTKEIQLELAELRRKRDLAQEMIYESGANVPKLKADIASFGVKIDALQLQYEQAISADIGGNAVEAATNYLIHAHHGSADAWKAYWAELDIDHQRALIKSLMPNARLLLAGSGNRIVADQHPALAQYSDEELMKMYAERWLNHQLQKIA